MTKGLILCFFGFLFLDNNVAALSEEMQELADMLHATCVGETGANEDDILNARKGVFADKEEFKCYIKCLMAQMACIEDDGVIDEEATIAVLPEEYRDTAAPVIRKCGTKKGNSPCENAWLTHQCYYTEAPNIQLKFFLGTADLRRNFDRFIKRLDGVIGLPTPFWVHTLIPV